MLEKEVKYLDIIPDEIQNKLLIVGAKKVGEYFYRRRVFDYHDWKLDKAYSWIRLRDEGDRIMLGFKKRLGVKDGGQPRSDDGMEEVEVAVDDFDKTGLFLEKIGLVEKFYQENK